MKALVCSGGGAKGAFTAGVVTHLIREQNIGFNIAIGTSTGSLVGGPALLGEWEYLRDIYIGVNNPDILNNTLLGKLISLIVSSSVPLQASMDPLRQLLYEYYIDDGKLQLLKDKNKELVVTSVDVSTGKINYVSSNQVPVEISEGTFVDAIVASASIPVLCKATQIYASEPNHPLKDHLFYDGGVKEFLPVGEAVRRQATQVWAVSTHPLKYNQTDWGKGTSPGNVKLFNALKWTLSSALNEVERGDLFRALAFYRVGTARSKVEQIIAAEALEPRVKGELLKVLDDMFDRVPDMIKELRVISPKRIMSASLEFDTQVMLAYFADGYDLTKDIYDANGDIPLFEETGDFVLELPV